MKHFLSILLVILSLTLLSVPALSDIPDFSSMTDEELLSALTALNEEIESRGLSKRVKLPAGTYIIGIDMPAGKYLFTTKDNISLYNGEQILVYENEYWYINRNGANKQHRLVNEKFYEPSTCIVNLEEGNVLYLVNGEFYAEKYDPMSLFE